MATLNPEPGRDCPLCPRLVAYREDNRRKEPTWFNDPAPSFGDPNARLLAAPIAPGGRSPAISPASCSTKP